MADNELSAIWSIRREISDRCDGDVDRVLDFYEEVQKRMKESGKYEFVQEPLAHVEVGVEEGHPTN